MQDSLMILCTQKTWIKWLLRLHLSRPQVDAEDFPEDNSCDHGRANPKAVECYEAGATVLHLHVRELDRCCN